MCLSPQLDFHVPIEEGLCISVSSSVSVLLGSNQKLNKCSYLIHLLPTHTLIFFVCCQKLLFRGGKTIGQRDQETEDFFFLGHINMDDQLNRKMEKDIASRLENWFAG